ncbi:hypothetical protein GCM10010285_32290 [Streptomyces pseudogriseolus]|uniref:Uncharacterized protein n=1 Tax=Streptomyces pseudogriseolus TaxID=36817 RepID=A0ABQ2T6W0_STREZ|nr:hypothetical protein GCM10010285_32290 [Streptomyces rubiginosus]
MSAADRFAPHGRWLRVAARPAGDRTSDRPGEPPDAAPGCVVPRVRPSGRAWQEAGSHRRLPREPPVSRFGGGP